MLPRRRLMLIPAILLTVCILVFATRRIFAPRSESFEVYRPKSGKDSWARDAVLTQVLSSGRLA